MDKQRFCDVCKIKKEKIAEGFFSEVFILYLMDGSKRVVKKFHDSIMRTEENRKRFVCETMEKYSFLKKNEIQVLDLYYSHKEIFSDFLNINNNVVLTNNINLCKGILYFDKKNKEKFLNEQIEIDNFDKILSQLAYLIWKASLSNIELSFDALFFKINLDNEFQDNLDVLIGDYDKVGLRYDEVDIYLNNHCAVWSCFKSFLEEFYKKSSYDMFKYELLPELETGLKKKVQVLRGIER